MKNLTLKKCVTFAMIALMLVAIFSPFFAIRSAKALENNVLRVYSWEDYMDTDFILGNSEDGIVGEFVNYYKDTYGEDIEVEYMTFGTNEIMYNNIKINGSQYDLLCPSDYMIEKMAREGMLQKLDYTKLPSYNANMSPYIDSVMKDITWQVNGTTESLYDYATVYMWGTLGLVYNAENVPDYDMQTWRSLWNIDYENKCTIKDSVRDSYFLGLAYTYRTELYEYATQFKSGALSLADYQLKLKELFNRVDDQSIAKVEEDMKTLRKNLYGFEVDSGKSDVASGKIDINYAWSGDAAYAIEQGEEVGRTLKYSIPEEGSNIWFDGWVIPNGANTELAYAFIEYLMQPEIAVRNMEYIGYTSSITGNGTFEIDRVDEETNQEYTDSYTGILDWIIQNYEVQDTPDEEHIYPNDISYLFGQPEGSLVLYGSEYKGMFMTTYPSQSDINRCAFMQYFPDEINTKINEMWERVKGTTLPTWVTVLIIVSVILVVALVICLRYKMEISDFIHKIKRGNGKGGKNGPKKPKVIKVEEI